MHWPWETITDVISAKDVVRRRRFGVIESRSGVLAAIHFRPFPTLASLPEAGFDRLARNWRRKEDRCWVYFNEPRSCPGYLTLAYFLSSTGTSLATVQAALKALDEIAKIKRSDAIVCDASNLRLTDRMLARFGYENHAPKLTGRHFIKRFTHPTQYEFLRRPLAEIFPEERLAVREVLHT